MCISSWVEQRNFTSLALQALADHPIVPQIQAALKDIQPRVPNVKGMLLLNQRGFKGLGEPRHTLFVTPFFGICK